MQADCLFCKMVRGELKPDVVYEDDDVLAFRDIAPQAPVHLLIIPKRHLNSANDVGIDETFVAGAMVQAAATIARDQGFADAGYRLVMNCNGDGGQTVFHLHLHLLAGRAMAWPPFPR